VEFPPIDYQITDKIFSELSPLKINTLDSYLEILRNVRNLFIGNSPLIVLPADVEILPKEALKVVGVQTKLASTYTSGFFSYVAIATIMVFCTTAKIVATIAVAN
jgi:hypothetical protein